MLYMYYDTWILLRHSPLLLQIHGGHQTKQQGPAPPGSSSCILSPSISVGEGGEREALKQYVDWQYVYKAFVLHVNAKKISWESYQFEVLNEIYL